MFFVLTMHYFDLGTPLHSAVPLSFSYDFSWFMEGLSIIGVNLFVMITGYFQCTSKFKIKKLANLWLEVIFYCVAIYVLLVFLKMQPFSYKALIHNAMPISNKFYWFISCYIALYLISPFLNAGIKAIDKRQHQILIGILFAMFYLWPLYLKTKLSFPVSAYPIINLNGFSLTHFVFLYILASYIRLYWGKKNHFFLYSLGYLCCAFLVGVYAIYVARKTGKTVPWPSEFYGYDNILVIFEAFFFFMIFRGFKFKSRFINAVGGLTFAVYIIHNNYNIGGYILQNIFHIAQFANRHMIVFHYAFTSVCIFSACIIIDFFRKKLFDFIGMIIKKLYLISSARLFAPKQ